MLKQFRELPLWEQWLWVSVAGGSTLTLAFKVVGWWDAAELLAPIGVFLAQWLLLRGRVRGAGWWVLASAVFGFIGLGFGGYYGGRLQDLIDGVASSPLGIAARGTGRSQFGYYAGSGLAGVFAGAILGFGQWLVFRRTLKRASVWILATTVGSTLGGLLNILQLGIAVCSTLSLRWLWEANYTQVPASPAEEPPLRFGWRFFLLWLWLTILGFGIGSEVSNTLGYPAAKTSENVRNVIAWFAGGACVGAAQWYLLRRELVSSWRWVLATALGFAVGVLLFVRGTASVEALLAGVLAVFGVKDFPFALLDDPLGGAFVGGSIGILQWVVLRRNLVRSGWWIPASAAGWALTYVLTNGTGPVALKPSLAFAVITGSLTGIAALWILPDRQVGSNTIGR